MYPDRHYIFKSSVWYDFRDIIGLSYPSLSVYTHRLVEVDEEYINDKHVRVWRSKKYYYNVVIIYEDTFEQAVENGSDLARSNLADILRKGSQGYPKDLRRAFDLYKACGLPYAHYRVGEFYEHGWGVRQDLEAAKAYYRLAYKEGHGLAAKKLKEFNFLE